jgi:NTP pyrophosphatase (non-canonical NTP hydrolase)
MNFSEYQKQALHTDQIPAVEGSELIIPLLGLVGEVGSLMTEYKKHLRDGDAHKLFKEGIAEELGDMLWYISNIASKFNLDLQEIAEDNLIKCNDRWGWRDSTETDNKNTSYIFDNEFPEHESLPAYAAVLGWSVVTRSILKRKRKSNPLIDEVEDGGRAVAIEEGISALVFSYAKDHGFLEGVSTLDYQLLKTIKNMTSHLEVSQCSLGDWEKAILMGYDVWRQVEKNRGATVLVDIDAGLITYQI